MAGPQKKTAKGRLDKWYKLAKEQGFRSRAAFKLVQLAKKYNFLENAKVVIDLCAAPGGWLQVCSKQCKPGALLIGVDLVPIKPIPNVITFAEDINSDKCRAQLRQHMKTWKADCVIHDGAPNVGAAWVQDAYSQAELVLMSLKLACEFLIPGGTFVTKVFRSKDYNNLLWVFGQLFGKVEATKPQASRNVSAEIFVVCRNFKAPQKLDPKLLDPKSVFEDLPEAIPNQEAKVFHPERRKRHREGYEEGNYTQHTARPISEFVMTEDPITMLGTTNSFLFSGEEDLPYKSMDITTREVRACCEDLQVLGKKDFRNLLKWRLAARANKGLLPAKKEDLKQTILVEPLDEDAQIDEEITQLNEAQKAKARREKRRANEKRQKEILRMQMGMTSAMDIGVDQGTLAIEDAMFALRDAEKKSVLSKIVGNENMNDNPDLDDLSESEEEDLDLDDQLDLMYDQYRDRKASSDAKFKAKKARKDKAEDDWDGFGNEKSDSDHSDIDTKRGVALDDSDSDDYDEGGKLSTSLDRGASREKSNGLTKRASQFFERSIFQDLVIPPTSQSQQDMANSGKIEEFTHDMEATKNGKKSSVATHKEKANNTTRPQEEQNESDSEDEVEDPRAQSQRSIDIITAEAMTLAQQIASKSKSTADVIDDGFNKWAFNDTDSAPDWFLDDEKVHNKPNLPITKEAADALREKMRTMNARPIKKILEAKGRKKQRALRTLSKINQKANVINDTEDLTERQKAQSITRLLNRAAKSKPKNKVNVVVASGANRGVQGRPKNVKGPYKMVDSRGKKEARAEKRIAKKKKKGSRR